MFNVYLKKQTESNSGVGRRCWWWKAKASHSLCLGHNNGERNGFFIQQKCTDWYKNRHFLNFVFLPHATSTWNHPHFLSPWENKSNLSPLTIPHFSVPLYQRSSKDLSPLVFNFSLPILTKIHSRQSPTTLQNRSSKSHVFYITKFDDILSFSQSLS